MPGQRACAWAKHCGAAAERQLQALREPCGPQRFLAWGWRELLSGKAWRASEVEPKELPCRVAEGAGQARAEKEL